MSQEDDARNVAKAATWREFIGQWDDRTLLGWAGVVVSVIGVWLVNPFADADYFEGVVLIVLGLLVVGLGELLHRVRLLTDSHVAMLRAIAALLDRAES